MALAITNTGWPRSRRLVARKGLADPSALETRKEAWADAYRNTPHGQPVELLHTRTADVRWLLLGLACTLAIYWLLQPASVESFGAGAGLGALLGMRHALEPDHLAAISTLMTGERAAREPRGSAHSGDWGTR